MLIGRDNDRSAVVSALESSRVVSIVGPGGVGKTALARAVLTEIIAPERAAFVDLTSAHGRLLEVIAGQLGFVSFESMVKTIDGSRWVFVLDNCEHVRDAAAAAAELLVEKCPSAVITATSREPLEVPGEVIVRLDPLPTHGRPSPAATMFVTSAAERGVVLGEDTAVEAICVRLDGLPLAIELAAAKTRTMTPTEILEALDDPLAVLTHERRRGPDRHRSLLATVDWSYRTLDAAEQDALECLSVFEGPFSRPMAAAAVGSERPESLLESLVDRSLLVHEPAHGRSWFRMLETIKAFARGRAGVRFMEIFERVVDDVTHRLTAAADEPVMSGSAVPDLLDRSFPTTRMVLETYLERGEPDPCLTLIRSFWWLEDVGHQSEAAELIDDVLRVRPDPTAATSVAYAIGAGLKRLAGRRTDAQEMARIATASDSGLGAALGHRILGQLTRGIGEWETALDHFHRGAEAAFRSGNEPLGLEISAHAGLVLARSGKVEEGIEALEDLSRRAEPYPLCHDWIRLFLAWTVLSDDPARAARLSREVLDGSSQHQANAWARGSCHLGIAVSALLSGDTSAATRHLIASLEAFLGIRNTTDVTLTLLGSAALFSRLGLVADAQVAVAAAGKASGLEHLGAHELDLFERAGPMPPPPDGEVVGEPSLVLEALRRLQDRGSTSGTTANRFERSGDMWVVSFEGATAHVADSKGMGDIAVLLARPGVDIAAADLIGARVTAGSVEASDASALRAYRARVRDLQSELDGAQADNDTERAAVIRAEIEALEDHLTTTYGLRGTPRRSGDPGERARSAVTWRIRAAVRRVSSLHPSCGEHLDRSISTGRFCRYEPEHPTVWQS